MNKLILHSDLNNFYASVECRLNPDLEGKAVAVAGNPERRHGVVLAKNRKAKAAGVKTGDVIWQARQKCPDIVFVEPHFDLYEKFSKQVFGVYTRFTPLVEPFGPDECWLDCTGCERIFGNGEEIAKKILAEVKKETGLTVSVGVSFTKSLAKICSDLAEPDDYFVADKENFRKKLYSLPASDLMMVGRSTTEALKKINVITLGDLAEADEKTLRSTLGINGIKLREAARGEDYEPVREAVVSRENESVGHGMTTVRDVVTADELRAILDYLSEKVASRLVHGGVKGTGIHVDLRSSELSHSSKQAVLSRPTYSALEISETAFRLALELIGKRKISLRTVSVAVYGLVPADGNFQVSMFEKQDGKRDKLEEALDKIRTKYGKDTIVRANLIGTDFIYDKNDSEDFLPFRR